MVILYCDIFTEFYFPAIKKNNTIMELYCFLCPRTFSSVYNVSKHLKIDHHLREDVNGRCEIRCVASRECTKSFKDYKTMNNHSRNRCLLATQLHCISSETSQNINIDCNQNSANDVHNDETPSPEEIRLNVQRDTQEELIIVLNDETYSPEFFFLQINILITSILKLLISFKVPKQLMVSVLQQLEKMISKIKQILHKHLEKNIQDYKNSSSCEQIDIFFENIILIIVNYRSEYMVNKMLRESKNYVAPIPVLLGGRWENINVRGTYRERFKLCEFAYVSIKQTIDKLFKNNNFRDNFFNADHKCTNGIYKKFCCGKAYSSNMFFKDNPNAIRLQLYFDEFRLTKSPQNETTKLGGVYYTIENLPTVLNSHIDHINLLALFTAIDLKNFAQSYNTILYPIVEEIKELEENGIQVNDENIKGTLATHAGDSLAIHLVFGMFGSFTHNFFCQHCKISKEESERATKENPIYLRTSDEYRNLFQGDRPPSFPNMNSAFGYKMYTLLNDLQNYDIFVTMIVDFMHDVAEGNIPLVLSSFLKIVIKKHILTLDRINMKIVSFDYGVFEARNKPGYINLNNDLMGLSASQKLVLFLHFSIIFPELVLDERLKVYWKPVSHLLAITKICLLTELSEKDLDVLEETIETYLTEYIEIYQRHLTPKQHFLVHYPRVIRNCGPPTTMWSMRYVFFYKKSF